MTEKKRLAGRPMYRSVHTQTAVRDGETQTMPCALDMTCNLGTRVELLEIAWTAHGLSVCLSVRLKVCTMRRS